MPTAALAEDSSSPTPVGERFSTLFWRKKHATIAYCCVFWSFGMCVAFLGPTLLDLGCKTGSSLATMGWVFFAQTLFILVGSATGAVLARRFDSNLILFASTIMLSITLAIIPLCYVVTLLVLVLAIMGYFMGVIDTLANVCMISLYGKDVSPFLQALHFFYGLGAFVSPMIAEPFLLGKSCNNSSSTIQRLYSEDPKYSPDSTDDVIPEDQHIENRISYAFWIMALLQIPVIVVVFSMLIRQMFAKGETDISTDRQKEEYEVMDTGGKTDVNGSLTAEIDDRPPASKHQAFILTLLTALLLFLYDGLQAAYGGYVFAYSENNAPGFTPTSSAYLNACFWGMFAFGRLISIALATKLSPDFMLLCNICGCIFSMIFMLSFPHHNAVLYAGTCMFGTFLSSIYPTAISLAEQYINVTSVLASCIIVGAASGEMLMPVIIGHEFESVGPLSLLISGVIMTILSLFVYAGIWLLGNSIIRRTATPGMIGLISSYLPKRGSEAEDSGLVTHHVKYYSRMKSTMSESSFGGDVASDAGHEMNQDEVVQSH